MIRLKRQRKRTGKKPVRRGTSTVEMALCAPVVFLLIFGSIEFSRMMMIRQALTNASRDACRNACLVTTQDDKSADEVARDWLAGVIANYQDVDTLRVEISPSVETAPPTGTEITAFIEVDCEDVSWLPPFFFAGAKIRGQSTMTKE